MASWRVHVRCNPKSRPNLAYGLSAAMGWGRCEAGPAPGTLAAGFSRPVARIGGLAPGAGLGRAGVETGLQSRRGGRWWAMGRRGAARTRAAGPGRCEQPGGAVGARPKSEISGNITGSGDRPTEAVLQPVVNWFESPGLSPFRALLWWLGMVLGNHPLRTAVS